MRSAVLTLLIFFLLYSGCSESANLPQQIPEPEKNLLYIEIVDSRGVSENFTLDLDQIQDQVTLLEAMQDAGVDVGIQRIASMNNAAMVVSVNSISQNPEKGLYWKFYYDGDWSPMGVEEFIISRTSQISKITWKLEAVF